MDIALDTNAISAYFGGDAAVASAIRSASSVLMFPFVVGELEAGFRGGNRYEANKKVLKSFLSEPNVRIVQTTLRTTELFGELKDSLRKAGTLIPIDDVWIGAMAKEHLAQVVSFDHHFGFMVPLGVDWMNPKTSLPTPPVRGEGCGDAD